MAIRFLMNLFFILTLIDVSAQPNVFILNGSHLQTIKNKLQQRDQETVILVDKLKKPADELLDMKLISVTDKSFVPASGNKHDYMSLAPYFWYDSTKPNGLPYMRKDGERNPEIYKITDHKYLSDLDNATQILSLAYYLTGEEKYAGKAASLLKHWFFDKDFKMNPNLDYAQAIPGKNNGRGIGIIETRSLTGIADAAGLLANSKAWTNSDTKSLQDWYAQFLNWMLTSKNGNDEHTAQNNHGTWFLVQAIDYALFTGNKSEALKLSEEGRDEIDRQITSEGKMPLELERTNALGYSTFNLDALFTLASLAEKSGVDLWHYKNVNGTGLQTILDWIIPYALDEKKWDYKQIVKYNNVELYPLLITAADKFKQPSYRTETNSITPPDNNVLIHLLFED
ncbi:alginate lyase family protein [Ginsengibacter hankyongi]|uniref:Alginate lyase family protein n=1 Tax=Ginsengibacter hankyongi TaxID=2607284 RepID=A0A5J5IN11_9BACT|nr:alginate lyase family protein [Ginsengibacter hankyongi]KAA9041387.1 alginate lyase family protein [Ginsengibacter hankyongi]